MRKTKQKHREKKHSKKANTPYYNLRTETKARHIHASVQRASELDFYYWVADKRQTERPKEEEEERKKGATCDAHRNTNGKARSKTFRPLAFEDEEAQDERRKRRKQKSETDKRKGSSRFVIAICLY